MTRSPRASAVVSLVAASLALAALARPAAERPASPPPEHEWRVHGGDPGHTQHSPLGQITPANVSRLRVAWTYRTGDAREGGRSQIQCNPIVVDGVLYATSAGLEAFALDAATGRERWRFDPFAAGAEESALGVNRGVVYWSDGRDRRVLYSAGQVLFALDASTGTLVPGFGTGGFDTKCSLKSQFSLDSFIITDNFWVQVPFYVISQQLHITPNGVLKAFDKAFLQTFHP